MLEEKSYDAVLSESYDYFQNQGISILGEGYREIASNPALFESYVETLTEGASANSAAVMTELMSNTNRAMLRESSMTGIQPVASLSMPVIRKLWPKFALKDALKTEVAKAPRFVVSYMKPYYEYVSNGNVVKRYLPDGMREGEDLNAGVKKEYRLPLDTYLFTVPASGEGENAVPAQLSDLVEIELGAAKEIKVNTRVETSSAIKEQKFDEFLIKSVITNSNEEAKIYNKRLSVEGTELLNLGEGKGQLVVQFFPEGKAILAYIGGAAQSKIYVNCLFGMSTEYNEISPTVGFDIARQDIDIPSGLHLNAALPIEALNDAMALYQIDGTKETVDLMTNMFAQKLDLEVLDFLKNSFENQPSNEAFANYRGHELFAGSFDCIPAAGFAGSPKAWREEIKPLIDFLATKIKNATLLQAGVFTIVGNPLDVNIISNVDWSFRAGQGNSMDGVDVDYSTGTYMGANAYKVIASTNVPAGEMYMLFTPSSDTQMTYKYYPYTFSTEMGYTDPNRSRVPSIMMTKRHTFHEFMPAIAKITIINNTGSPYATYLKNRAVNADAVWHTTHESKYTSSSAYDFYHNN